MKFYPVTPDELKRGRMHPPKSLLKKLEAFINSGEQIVRVEDDRFNNNNDLRRSIQHCIENNGLPIHVFMKYGKTYIEREDGLT